MRAARKAAVPGTPPAVPPPLPPVLVPVRKAPSEDARGKRRCKGEAAMAQDSGAPAACPPGRHSQLRGEAVNSASVCAKGAEGEGRENKGLGTEERERMGRSATGGGNTLGEGPRGEKVSAGETAARRPPPPGPRVNPTPREWTTRPSGRPPTAGEGRHQEAAAGGHRQATTARDATPRRSAWPATGPGARQNGGGGCWRWRRRQLPRTLAAAGYPGCGRGRGGIPPARRGCRHRRRCRRRHAGNNGHPPYCTHRPRVFFSEHEVGGSDILPIVPRVLCGAAALAC